MSIRNTPDCPHGWSSEQVCPSCTSNSIMKMQEELLDFKNSTINVLRAQINDLDENVAHLKKRMENADELVEELKKRIRKAEKFAASLPEPERSTMLCELKGI